MNLGVIRSNGFSSICVYLVCDCVNHINDDEIRWWLGVAAGCTSNHLGFHCREDARGMVRMEIKLDDHYTIVGGRHGQIQLIRHKANPKRRKGKIINGDTLYFQTFGQAVKTYIKKSANESDIKTLEELAAFIDGKLKGVELKINQVLEEEE